MPTISMFYGILIRMFFYDTDRHSVPHIHAEYQGQFAVYSRFTMVLCWLASFHRRSTNWLSHGLKYTYDKGAC